MRRWTEGLHLGDHVLHVYQGADDRERAALEVFDWMPHDAKMFYFASADGIRSLLGLEGEIGDRIRAGHKEGRLTLSESEATYCPGGQFHSAKVLQGLRMAVVQAQREGYGSMVALGDAAWLSTRPQDFAEFVRYESGINFLDLPLNVALICQYDGSLFTHRQLDQMRVLHDRVLTNRVLERNCYIIPNRKWSSQLF